MKIEVCVVLLLLLVASSLQEEYQFKTRTNGAFTRLMTKYNETNETLAEHAAKVTDLETENAELRKEFRKELDDIRKELNACKMTGAFSFEVRQKGRKLTVKNKAVLKFDQTRFNKGGAYNPSTGIFTVPVTGTYMFWASVMAYETGEFRVALYVEETEHVRSYTSRGAKYGTAHLTYITELSKGQRVWIATTESSSTLVIYGRNYTSYGGTLLTAA